MISDPFPNKKRWNRSIMDTAKSIRPWERNFKRKVTYPVIFPKPNPISWANIIAYVRMKKMKTMNFCGLGYVSEGSIDVSQPFRCLPNLMQITLCQRELGSKGKRHSHLLTREIFLKTRFPITKSPSSLGLQTFSQATKWSLPSFPAPHQRNRRIIPSKLSAAPTGNLKRDK